MRVKNFDSDLKLCYVESNWAWFTSLKDVRLQWGDDWNDAPYEHNAGTPYEYHDAMRPRLDQYVLVKIAWEGPFIDPAYDCINSRFSVEQINRGDIAWLRPSYGADENELPIYAGITLKHFCQRMIAAGGKIYLEAADV